MSIILTYTVLSRLNAAEFIFSRCFEVWHLFEAVFIRGRYLLISYNRANSQLKLTIITNAIAIIASEASFLVCSMAWIFYIIIS